MKKRAVDALAEAKKKKMKTPKKIKAPPMNPYAKTKPMTAEEAREAEIRAMGGGAAVAKGGGGAGGGGDEEEEGRAKGGGISVYRDGTQRQGASGAVAAAAAKMELPLSDLSSAPVVQLTGRWIGTIRAWVDTIARRAAAFGSCLDHRQFEFVRAGRADQLLGFFLWPAGVEQDAF